MRDKDLYARILGLEAPWHVTEVDLRREYGEVIVTVEHERGDTDVPPKNWLILK